MYVNRKLILLWIVCLTLIIISIIIRQINFHNLDGNLFGIIGSTDRGGLEKPNLATDLESNSNSESGPAESFYESNEATTTTVRASPNTQTISARAYLVGNVVTGQIYLKKNIAMVLPVASMSKLITAVEAIDKFSSSQKVTISKESSSTPDTSDLKPGEVFTVTEILYPLLLNSSNIAAEALSSTTNRNKFMELMSSYAWEIGMPATYFADPSGIDSHNVSSAQDFFALAKYLYNLRPDILAITRTAEKRTATTTDHGSHIFRNIHPFVYNKDFLGGKTGHTNEAKDTMLTIIKIYNQPIAIIVLASNNRRTDTLLLIADLKKNLANDLP